MEQRSSAELRQYFGILLKWWWLILIVTAVAGVSAYLVSQASPKTYQSKATIMIGQVTTNQNPDQSFANTTAMLAQSYADLAVREQVLQGTLDQLNLDWSPAVLKNQVTARVVGASSLLEISVVDTDPVRA